MKRTAAQAFPGQGAGPGAPAAFAPNAAAMVDPKAYFAQWQKAMVAGQAAAGPSVAAAPSADAAKSPLQKQVEDASAVKCAQLLKDEGKKFTPIIAIEALATMATKSSYKLREELLKQIHVKKLGKQVADLVKSPPPSFSLEVLMKASWSLSQFPDEILAGADAAGIFASTAKMLSLADPTSWKADHASRVLWTLSKAEVIVQHTKLVTQVLGELVRDKGRRFNQLSDEALVQLLHAVARARPHLVKGGTTLKPTSIKTVHIEVHDEEFFHMAGERIIRDVDKIDVKLLADTISVHNEIGIRNEPLFKALCPKIVKEEKKLDMKSMGKCIKAYTRFMIPLREEQQGFRTMAIVQKGDFIRPSDKPEKKGKKTFERPLQLFAKTPVHSRG